MPPNCNFFGCKCDPDQTCCVPAIQCYDGLCDPLEFPCDKKKYHGVEGNKVKQSCICNPITNSLPY